MNYWTKRINCNSACICVNSLCVVEGKSCVWVSHLLLILQGTGSRILLRYTHTDQIRSFLVCSSSKHTHSSSPRPTIWLPLLYNYNNAIIRSTVSLPPFLRLGNYSTRLQPTVAQSLCSSLMIWKSLNHNNATRTEATVSQPHTHTPQGIIYTLIWHTQSQQLP